jgi:hypothetical protein
LTYTQRAESEFLSERLKPIEQPRQRKTHEERQAVLRADDVWGLVEAPGGWGSVEGWVKWWKMKLPRSKGPG